MFCSSVCIGPERRAASAFPAVPKHGRTIGPSASWRWLTWILCAMVMVAEGGDRADAQQAPVSLVAVETLQSPVEADRPRLVGTFTPKRRSVIGSAVDGRVQEIFVDAGIAVEQGQPLAQLLARSLEIELAAAQAELELRVEELAELENGSRPEEIAQAKALLESSQARMQYSVARGKRLESLYAQRGSTSLEEFELAQSVATEATQAVAQAQAAYDLAVQGPRPERKAQAQARVAMQKQVIEGLRDRLEKHTLKAPFAGVVVQKLSEVGQWVQQGESVVEVIEIDPIEVTVPVPEQWIQLVAVGQEAEVSLSSAPTENHLGTVDRIAPQADLRARSFPVYLRVPNPDRRLLAGMLAEVKLAVKTRAPGVSVPKDALVLGDRGENFLFVLQPAAGNDQLPTVRQVAVELLRAVGNRYEISGEVAWGDTVVVEGNERLQNAQPVKVIRRSSKG